MNNTVILGGGAFTLEFPEAIRRCTVAHYRRRDPRRLPTLRRVVGGTEYVITARLSTTARETAAAKLRRLMLNASTEN